MPTKRQTKPTNISTRWIAHIVNVQQLMHQTENIEQSYTHKIYFYLIYLYTAVDIDSLHRKHYF